MSTSSTSGFSSLFRSWLFAEVLQGQEQILCELMKLNAQLAQSQIQGAKIMAAIDDLEAKVAEETDVETAAVTLLGQLSAMITAAGTDPKRLAAVTSLIDARKARLAAAIVANTPAAAGAPPA